MFVFVRLARIGFALALGSAALYGGDWIAGLESKFFDFVKFILMCIVVPAGILAWVLAIGNLVNRREYKVVMSSTACTLTCGALFIGMATKPFTTHDQQWNTWWSSLLVAALFPAILEIGDIIGDIFSKYLVQPWLAKNARQHGVQHDARKRRPF